MKKLLAILMLCCGCATPSSKTTACVLKADDCDRIAIFGERLMDKVAENTLQLTPDAVIIVNTAVMMYTTEAYSQCVNNTKARYDQCMTGK